MPSSYPQSGARVNTHTSPAPTSPTHSSSSRSPRASRDTATLIPYAWEAYNEIVQPHRWDVYLIDKWLKDLGPTGFALVKAFRRRAYHNPKGGETRNCIEVDLAEIAASTGIGKTTIYRQLEENKALKQFVQLVQHNYIVVAVGKAPIRHKPEFMVAMDEPIHPDDMERYELLRAQREVERARLAEQQAQALQGAKFRCKGVPASGVESGQKPVQKPAPSPKSQNGIKGNDTAQATELPKSQNGIKGGTKSQNGTPYSQNGNPYSQNGTDAPYMSSLPSSLLGSLHAEDGVADPPINSPKGGEEPDGDETLDGNLATWNVALAHLATKVNKPTLETHLRLVRLMSVSPTGDVVLAAKSDFSRDWIAKRHQADVEAALEEALGSVPASVQIITEAK